MKALGTGDGRPLGGRDYGSGLAGTLLAQP